MLRAEPRDCIFGELHSFKGRGTAEGSNNRINKGKNSNEEGLSGLDESSGSERSREEVLSFDERGAAERAAVHTNKGEKSVGEA